MRFSEIRLEDFGCFVDAGIRDLDDGLTVIAGPQRAGKTTFMQAVRQFGYGISQGSNLPPPSDRYTLSAIVEFQGNSYRIGIDHFAAPTVTSLDPGAPDRSARDLFGGMRQEQYRQLYTISLDELRRDPASLDDDVELARVLLGAGFGDARRLPDIIDDLGSQAYDIGRTTGRRGGAIKEAIDAINAGIDHRDDALEHVDTYERKTDELAAVEDRIDKINDACEALENEGHRLVFVRSEYENYERLETLRQSIDEEAIGELEAFPLDELGRVEMLAETYTDVREELRRAESDFATQIHRDDLASYRDQLLDAHEEIQRDRQHLERYRGEVDQIDQREQSLAETAQDLRSRIENLHSNWSELSDIRSVEMDLPTMERLRNQVRAYRRCDERIRDARERIDHLETRIEEFDMRIDEAVGSEGSKTHRSMQIQGAIAVIVAIIAGAASGLIHPLVGVLVTAGILAAAGFWLYGASADHKGVDVQHLRAQRQELKTELEAEGGKLTRIRSERESLDTSFADIRQTFDLPEETEPSTIETFVESFRDIRREIDEYDIEVDTLAADRTDLEEELSTVVDRLVQAGVTDTRVGDPIDDCDRVFRYIERANEHLDAARQMQRLENECESVEHELAPILADGLPESPQAGDPAVANALESFQTRGAHLADVADQREEIEELEARLIAPIRNGRLADAFEPIGGEDELAVVESVVRSHESKEAIEERLDAIEAERSNLEGELEDKREELVDLKQQIEQLQSDTDIRAAHEKIQRGRADLERHLENYAQNRIAEHLLTRLQEHYLERTTGELLQEASEIFTRITDGTYTSIESTDEFEDLDFHAALDGNGVHASAELSRATAEQLFLAIRLARMTLEDEPLPVLIDDSLTNFDPGHVYRTLDVIGELAERHQVFLLTCHPQMLDQVSAFGNARYYALDAGRFDGPYESPDEADSLLTHQVP